MNPIGLAIFPLLAISQVFAGPTTTTPLVTAAVPTVTENIEDIEVETRFKKPDVLEWLAVGTLLKGVNDGIMQYPDIELGCATLDDTTAFTTYNIFSYTGCDWVDVRGFPDVKTIFGFSDDDSTAIVSNTRLRLFESVLLPPEAINISTNGFAIIGSSPGVNSISPGLDNDNNPYEVVSALGTDLVATVDGEISYANFRMGQSACMRIQWDGFEDITNNNEATFQLDMCDNGWFISRIKIVGVIGKVQIGVNTNAGGVYRAEFLEFTNETLPPNSAYVIRPQAHYDDLETMFKNVFKYI